MNECYLFPDEYVSDNWKRRIYSRQNTLIIKRPQTKIIYLQNKITPTHSIKYSKLLDINSTTLMFPLFLLKIAITISNSNTNLQTICQVTHSFSIAIIMRNNNNFVPSLKQTLWQLIYMIFYSSRIWVEKIWHHTVTQTVNYMLGNLTYTPPITSIPGPHHNQNHLVQ